MYYDFMRKNSIITKIELSDDGQMIWYAKNLTKNRELLPLQNLCDSNGLKKWWEHRSVPLKQGKIQEMLIKNGLSSPSEYLMRNLGLSLTDYYWIRPENSSLTWEQVNLFDNDFTNDFVKTASCDGSVEFQYVPGSSLQGALEKKWVIRGSDRYLIKGNCDNSSTESINEVIASRIHSSQGYDNYTNYQLTKIAERDYDYGCACKAFTSQKNELVSAYSIVTSRPKPNDTSMFEHFIDICTEYGIDREQLRRDLEYQIQTDFLLSNRDRHLNNIAIIRDAQSLKFVRMAPIFDSGKCMHIRRPIPETEKEFLSLETESFASTELKMLSYVHDRHLVDVSKLPSPEIIRHLYEYDSQMEDHRISKLCTAYEKKIDLYRNYQLGKDLNQIRVAFTQKRRSIGHGKDEFIL